MSRTGAVVVLSWVLGAGHCYAQVAKACDLRVVVRDYADNPLDREDVPVKAIVEGHVVAEASSIRGVAALCDVGIRPFDLVVGREIGGQVTIKALQVQVRPLLVPVYYRSCHAFPVHGGCRVLLRIEDFSGHRLAGAELQVSKRTSPLQALSDGRWEFSVPYQTDPQRIIVEVAKPGFETARESLECSPGRTEAERTIVLKRTPE
jgi:hypothetical protein